VPTQASVGLILIDALVVNYPRIGRITRHLATRQDVSRGSAQNRSMAAVWYFGLDCCSCDHKEEDP
jgi:hypothetical protein